MPAPRSTSALVALALVMFGVAPAAAATLHLTFTAPGDDGRTGRAVRYDVRYATAPITEATFAQSARVPFVPAPSAAGSYEEIVVGGLVANTIYWFAIKTVDEAGNWSAMSNVAISPRTTTARGDTISTLVFAPPQPNPARQSVRLAYVVPRAGRVRLEVFDLGGRLVRRLFDGAREAGESDLVWDLRDAAGAPVHAGVYLARATFDGEALMQRLAVVR